MKFCSLLAGQKLILSRVKKPTYPTLPIVAKSAGSADPLIVRFILWLAALLKPAVSKFKTERFVIVLLVGIVATVILEAIAKSYVVRMVGV